MLIWVFLYNVFVKVVFREQFYVSKTVFSHKLTFLSQLPLFPRRIGVAFTLATNGFFDDLNSILLFYFMICNLVNLEDYTSF